MILFISIQNNNDASRAVIMTYVIFQGKLFCMVNEAVESDMMMQRKEIKFFDCLSMVESTDSSEEEDQMNQHDEDDSTTVSKDNPFISDWES